MWRERLCIGLAPDHLACVAWRRGPLRRVASQSIVPLAPSPGAAPWQSGLAALPVALAAAGRAPAVSIVLSNHFVRYALLPWNPALGTEAEWHALAAHHFAAVHGAIAEEWELRVAPSAPRGPRIAAAIDRALIEALGPAVEGAGATLLSVQPYLIAACNRLHKRIGRGSAWIAVVERGRLALALIEQGCWRAIRSRGLSQPPDLDDILERESALLALEDPFAAEVLVHADSAPATQADGGYRISDLTLAGPAAPPGREFAMALA